jgi:hypothetical protein
MKRLLLVLALLAHINSTAQTDAAGNPVLNSVIISEERVGNYLLGASYYPLKGNMDNKGSSAYVSDKPTLLEIDYAATHQASDFFVIVKNHSILKLIGLNNVGANWQWLVVDMGKGGSDGYMLDDTADITENRALELVRDRYDSTARIKGNTLYFDGSPRHILTNKKIKASLLALIARESLAKGDSTDIRYRTREETRSFILTETAKGGNLDFFNAIKGKESDGLQVKPGVYSTKLGAALYQWGKACYDLGLNTIEDAYQVYAKFKGRPLTRQEKDHIRMGFEKSLEH